MTLQQLRYLAAVVAVGNITEAAKRLNVSQPALSAGLSALETDLGGTLLDRKRGSVRLTQLGARFHRRALGILNECDLAKREFRQGLSRSFVTIGVLPTIAMPFVTEIVRRLSAVAPDLDISLREGDSQILPGWLSQGRIDLALTVSDRIEAGAWIPLFRDPLLLVCPWNHRLAHASSICLAELDGEAFVLRTHCERGSEAADVLSARGVRLRFVMRTDQDRRALDAVAAGIGVTIAPRSLVLDATGIATAALQDLRLARTVGAQLSASVKPDLAATLRSTLTELADTGLHETVAES
jgi:LysR family transcriptional regulator, hydrogen peroxide-inducible genes activator